VNGDLMRNLEKIFHIHRFSLDPEFEVTVAISNVILPVTLTEIQHGGQLIAQSNWPEKLCGRRP
jgi:hypothetical protein